MVSQEAETSGKRWMMIACGLPGDQEHRDKMTNAVSQLIDASGQVFGVDAERMYVLVGDEMMQSAVKTSLRTELCSAETVQATVKQVASKLAKDDELWIILLGHGHFYDTQSSFNVAGKDFAQQEFSQWLETIGNHRTVVILTTSVSGFWIKPLSRANRLIITATEPGLEITATEFPYAFADIVSSEDESSRLTDIDGDGALTLLDLYLATSREIVDRFRGLQRLQTEHAQLDDNGDGRGTEVQRPYLPSESTDAADGPDETTQTIRPPLIDKASLDGFRARQVLIKEPRK